MKKIATISLLTILVGCMSTVYQPKPIFGGGGGYEDGQLSENEYWLRYTGAGNLTKIDELKPLWLRRAKELCGDKEAKTEFKEDRKFGSAPQAVILKGTVKCV
ncbi:hypothetical protein [Thalassotalea fusca]